MGTYGSRLKEFRIYKQLSQQEFAEMCDSSQANVTQWETNRNKPSGKIINIQKAFPDLNIDWLETGIGEMILSKPFAKNTSPNPTPTQPDIEEIKELENELLEAYREQARLKKLLRQHGIE